MGYSSHGQVVNRTGYLLQLLIPSFIREISYGNNINRLVVDDDRHILYCLYKHNMIYGYYQEIFLLEASQNILFL